MLVLNTTFPINKNATVETLLHLGNEWIRNSPHTCMKEELLSYKEVDCSYEVQKCGESFESIRAEDQGNLFCGMRYKRNEGNTAYWTTDVVGVKHNGSFDVSIQVNCETSDYSYRPNTKKPYLIKLLHEKIGFSLDGVFPITDIPIYLKHDDVGLACSFINGDRCCNLPCVFVSINKHGEYNVSATDLARQLLGIAHVFVEPNIYFSFDLQGHTNGRNAYNGAVGVYFPASEQFHIIMPDKKRKEPQINREVIYNKIRDALLLQQTNRKYSYSFITAINYKKRLTDIEKKGDKNLSEYISNFDSELREKNEEIEKLKSEIYHLQHRLLSQQEIESVEGRRPLLYYSALLDNYQGESHDAVIDAIKNYMDNLHSNKRKKIVLQNIVDSNPLVGMREKIVSELKRCFKDYSSMTPTLKGELQRLGLCLEEGGKHYKLYFRGNSNCFATLVKTGSDHRGGKNTARDIINSLL